MADSPSLLNCRWFCACDQLWSPEKGLRLFPYLDNFAGDVDILGQRTKSAVRSTQIDEVTAVQQRSSSYNMSKGRKWGILLAVAMAGEYQAIVKFEGLMLIVI